MGLLLLAFAILGLLVATGRTVTADRAVLALLRLPGKPGVADVPDWAIRATRGLTHGGDFPVRAGLALPLAIWLFVRRRARMGWALVLAVAGTSLLVEILKVVVARARPEPIWRLAVAHEASFPSGHAAGAMATYPLIGLILGALPGPAWARRGIVAGVVLALAIGGTRVLLGVHWASDVAAGWLLGGAIAALAARAAPGATDRTGLTCVSPNDQGHSAPGET